MRLNIDRYLVKQLVSGQLPNKSCHPDELTHEPAVWSCDTGQWLSCFDGCQLTILWMCNYTRCGLAKTRLRHTSLPFDSLPSLTICRRVRSVNPVTTKRKEVDHILWVRGSVPRALRARRSPAIEMIMYTTQSKKEDNIAWGDNMQIM